GVQSTRLAFVTITYFNSSFSARAPPSCPTRRSSDLQRTRQRDLDVRVVEDRLAIELALRRRAQRPVDPGAQLHLPRQVKLRTWVDRKSTRLNSSHEWISYAVFCLKKKDLSSNFLQAP